MECEHFYTVLSVCRAALIRRLLLGCMAPGSDTQPGRKLPVAAPGRPIERAARLRYGFPLSVYAPAGFLFVLFFCMEVSGAVAATLMVLGKKGTSRLTQPAGRPDRVSRSLINPDAEDSLFRVFFFMANSVLCCRWQQQSLGGCYLLATFFQLWQRSTHIKIDPSIFFPGSNLC